mmetsp:Transcript_12457/g.23033  ORF Transcript_12457/g.23033 Transcript_12457/m.23033 type:complete len:223 (+) Transcript_12457:65-733(+)|eukprot:CAMPEP_0201866892 /NCGR_PEP_ID=MMETSP0902-20130614/1317_1 /ASSEMBLY_ACC=CAM_ASM_000551 /TAXON_ID=420261 /ORGANISM="Thalassiosira antarctica, Strain CCMP982" /LENGTH=222 /DNA_ID=CAMNT_0048391939 /DNA_START=30 /DNA_END=698 /DNA_ORIENTATION=+
MSLFQRPLSTVFRAAAATPTIRASSLIITAAANTSPSSLSTTHRSKHSATQVKRLFKNNPARLRLLKKKNLPASAPRIPDQVYPPVYKTAFLSNGWSALPPPEVQLPDYPFKVTRTGRKPFGAVGFLPVYRDIRIHGTKHTTIIRNVAGDIPAFISELRAVLDLSLGKKGILTSASTGKHGGGEAGRGVNTANPIRIRTGGAIEVNGDRATEVRKWLTGLGF